MNDVTVVLNPRAGKGVAGRMRGRLEGALHDAGIRYRLVITEGPGHATELGRMSQSPTVVAVGGDGTVNEVANGILGTGQRLGIIPFGSGNDLIKSVSVPRELTRAVRCIQNGVTRTIDVGLVMTGESGEPRGDGGRVFVNGVGAGFDAAVAVRTREIPYLRGTLLYLVAVFQTLGRYTSPLFEVAIDGSRKTSRNLLMAVGNGRCAGGGFFLTPDAIVDDGLFDVCVVEKVSIPQILRLMPRVLRGRHHDVRQVSFHRGRTIVITSGERFTVHADGEIVGRDVTWVHISMSEHRLPVIVADAGVGS